MIITAPIESVTVLIIDQANISSGLFPNKAPTVTSDHKVNRSYGDTAKGGPSEFEEG